MSRLQQALKSKQLKMSSPRQDTGSKFFPKVVKDEKFTKWQFQISAGFH